MFRFLDCLINAIFRTVCLNWDPNDTSTLQLVNGVSRSVFTLYYAPPCLFPPCNLFVEELSSCCSSISHGLSFADSIFVVFFTCFSVICVSYKLRPVELRCRFVLREITVYRWCWRLVISPFGDVSGTDGHHLSSFIHNTSSPFKMVCKQAFKYIGTLQKNIDFFVYSKTWIVHSPFYGRHLFLSFMLLKIKTLWKHGT